MSKKNRYKFANKSSQKTVVQSPSNGSAISSSAPVSTDRSSGAFAQHAGEYRIIRSDMIRLVVLNGIMLAAVIALYYANRSSGVVEKLYTQLFN